MFIYLFSLCTDKIFCKWNKKKLCHFFMRIQCAFRWCTMWICSNFIQLSCIRYVQISNSKHIIAIWMHVTNEHTCKRTQNHLARKKEAARERGREIEKTHKAFKIHFTLASCQYVSLSVDVDVNVLQCTNTHTHTVLQCYALIHIYICNCSYNNSNSEQKRKNT